MKLSAGLSMPESSIKLTPLLMRQKSRYKVCHLNIGQPDLPTPEEFSRDRVSKKGLKLFSYPRLAKLREVFSVLPGQDRTGPG